MIAYIFSLSVITLAAWQFYSTTELKKNYVDTEIRYLRLKRNPDVIDTLLCSSPGADLNCIETPFSIGEKSSTRIDVWLTDNCRYCSEILDELEALVMFQSKFHLNIYPICNLPKVESESLGNNLISRISKQFHTQDISIEQLAQLKDESIKLGISSYPFVAINGKRLPPHLTITDIVYSNIPIAKHLT